MPFRGFGSSVRPIAQFPPLTPEEEDSLLKRIMGTAMGGLQFAAETLDKPGAAIRGTLAGKPEALLNLLPFSDSFGITDPSDRVYGSDMLVDFGLRERNDPDKWFEPGDFAGFAFDVATDPLSWINPLGAGTRGLHVAERAGIAQHLPAVAKKAVGADKVPGKRQMRSSHTLRELVEEARGKAVGQEAIDEIDTSLRGAAEGLGVNLDELMDQRLGGSVGFSAGPFGRPTAMGGPVGDVGMYGRMMDRIGGGIAASPPVRAGMAAWSKATRGQLDPVVQQELRNVDSMQKNIGPQEQVHQNLIRNKLDEAMASGGVDPNDLDATFAVRGYLEMGENLSKRAPELASKVTPQMQEILDPLRQQQTELWQRQIDLGYKNADDTFKSEWDNWFFHRLATGGEELDVARVQEIADLPLGTVQVERLLNDPLLTRKPEYRYTREVMTERGMDAKQIEEAEKLVERMRKKNQGLNDLGPQDAKLYRDYKDAQQVAGYRMTTPEQNQARELLIARGFTGEQVQQAERLTRELSEGTIRQSDLSNPQKMLLQARRNLIREIRRQHGPEGITERLGETGRYQRVAEQVYGMDEQSFRNARDLSEAIKNTKNLPNDNPAKFRDPRGLLRNTEGMSPERIADLERQASLLDNYDRSKKLAKWVHRHGFREKGDLLFGNHPIADHRSYMVSQRMNTELATGLHDIFARLAQPFESVKNREGVVGLGAAFDKLGFGNIPKAIEKFTEKTKGRFGDADVYIPKNVVENLEKLFKKNPFDKPKEVNVFLDRFDRWATNLWKMGATTWPAFHIRNQTSGIIQNILTGAYSPLNAIKYSNIGLKFSRGETIQGLSKHKGIKRIFGDVTDAEATEKLREVVDAYDLRGSRFDEIVEDALLRENAPDATPWEKLSPDLMAKPGAGPVGYATPFKTLKSIFRSDEGWRRPGEIGQSLDPRVAAGIGKDVVPEGAPLRAGERTETNRLSQAQRQAGRVVEDVNRIGPLLGYLDQGMSLDAAVQRVKAAQVDYRDLSEIDRAAMRRIMPFWSFFKGISKHTAKELLEHPGGKLAQTLRASNRGREGDAYTPDFVGEGLSIPIGDDKYIARLGLMHESPFEAFAFRSKPGDQEGDPARLDVMGTASRGLQKLGSMTTPYAKVPAEIAFDKQLFTGRKLKDLYAYPFTPGSILPSDISMLTNQLLAGSPASRGIGTVRKLSDERKSLPEKVISTASGIGITDVYGGAKRAKELDAARRMTEVLEASPRIREYSTLYSPKDMQEALTPTEKALLRLQTTQREKRKEAALAGQ